jgi:hypothetical protein
MKLSRWRRIKSRLSFVAGPLPLSIFIHLALLFIMLLAIKPERARELINVELEAGGGAGQNNEPVPELAIPDVPLPVSSSQLHLEAPPVVNTSDAVNLANEYARTETLGGMGNIGGEGSLGGGSNYGRAIGSGFGGYIGELRRNGLEVVLIIDGTGSMQYVVDDVRTKMKRLVVVLHQLVPTAKVGVVVYGGRREPLLVQPLTRSYETITAFLDQLKAQNGGAWQEDIFSGVDAAVLKMNWQLSSHKVIVLIGDTPPFDDDYAAVLLLAQRFKDEGGVFNTVDLTDYEHRLWEIANCVSGECGPGYEDVYVKHRRPPPMLPLPSFYLQTRRAYQEIARAGGGSTGILNEKVHINQEILDLSFGEQWQTEISAFGAASAR